MTLNFNAQLCFVSPDAHYDHFWLWFVDDLKKAHGDDWNDEYWPHNASPPLNEDAFAIPFDLNIDCNSWWDYPSQDCSVDAINAGVYAWLAACIRDKTIAIKAGMTLQEIVDLVNEIGGTAYFPLEKD